MAEMQTVNVEKIMEEIRADIAAQGYTQEELVYFKRLANLDTAPAGGADGAAGSAGVNAAAGSADIAALTASSQASFEKLWKLAAVPSSYPIVGNPIKVLIQKVLRRMSLFVVFPVVKNQNAFNQNLMNYLGQQQTLIAAQQSQLAAQQSLLASQQEEIAGLQAEIKSLKSKYTAEKQTGNQAGGKA